MKGLKQFPKSYFLKYQDKPVVIKEYDPVVTKIVKIYLKRINPILEKHNLRVYLRGSSLFKIPGKGDVELGIYLSKKNWFSVNIDFINYFGGIENIDKDIAIFNEEFYGCDIEIVCMKDHTASVDIALHSYLKVNKSLLTKYSELKCKYCSSKRIYQYQKDKFFRRIIKLIPDDFPNLLRPLQ